MFCCFKKKDKAKVEDSDIAEKNYSDDNDQVDFGEMVDFYDRMLALISRHLSLRNLATLNYGCYELPDPETENGSQLKQADVSSAHKERYGKLSYNPKGRNGSIAT